jgi:hypothetical protein
MKTMDPLQQLQALKMATLTTGALHEAQILQLKNYPLTLPSVVSASVAIDTDRKIVAYSLTVKSKKSLNSKRMRDGIQNVTKWVKFVLWDDSIVTFSYKGEVIHDSRFQST